jgi:hypothetical protein
VGIEPARTGCPRVFVSSFENLLLWNGLSRLAGTDEGALPPAGGAGQQREGFRMHLLDLAALRGTPLTRLPFPYVVVPGFIPPDACQAINADYPAIQHPGSFPIREVKYGPVFRSLLEVLQGDALRSVIEEKFDVDLKGRPMMITVRGRCGTRDGNIHTDAVSKIITMLIYMNPKWEEAGGRLRLLRSADDIEDVITEIQPVEGTLVAFRRTDNSYHGHKPFIGPRRVIQVNWVTSRGKERREVLRHRLSAWMKRMIGVILRNTPRDQPSQTM